MLDGSSKYNYCGQVLLLDNGLEQICVNMKTT